MALFAIAAQANPETIPLVVLLAPQDRPLAVEALSMYGAPGIEAAKRIPKPDPAKPAFASRGRRHVAATEALAKAGEPVALDRVREGLGEPIPTDIYERRKWRERMVGYLRIARARTDPHLVEPVVRLLQADSDRSLVQAAFDVLGFIDDDRVVPECLKHVPAHHYHSDAAMRALVRRLGKEAGPALFARFGAADDEKEKLRFGQALVRLRRHGAFGRGIPPHDVEERAEAVAGTEALALEALCSLLSTAGEGVQLEAADELASMWVFEKTREALTLLVPWADGMADPPGSVVIRLADGKADGAGPALLAAYRAGNLERGDVAKALGDLGYEPALPYVIEGLEQRLETLRASQQRVLEVYALLGLGEAGQHKVATLLDRDLPLPVLPFPRRLAARQRGVPRCIRADPALAARAPLQALARRAGGAAALPAGPEPPGAQRGRDEPCGRTARVDAGAVAGEGQGRGRHPAGRPGHPRHAPPPRRACPHAPEIETAQAAPRERTRKPEGSGERVAPHLRLSVEHSLRLLTRRTTRPTTPAR